MTLPSLAGLSPRSDERIAFLDDAHERGIERLRDNQRGLGNGQRGHLIERHLGAIGLDVEVFEQSGRRASCPHTGEFLADELDLSIHALFQVSEESLQIAHIHRSVSTQVG